MSLFLLGEEDDDDDDEEDEGSDTDDEEGGITPFRALSSSSFLATAKARILSFHIFFLSLFNLNFLSNSSSEKSVSLSSISGGRGGRIRRRREPEAFSLSMRSRRFRIIFRMYAGRRRRDDGSSDRSSKLILS